MCICSCLVWAGCPVNVPLFPYFVQSVNALDRLHICADCSLTFNGGMSDDFLKFMSLIFFTRNKNHMLWVGLK